MLLQLLSSLTSQDKGGNLELSALIGNVSQDIREKRAAVCFGMGKSKYVADRLAANLRLIGIRSVSFHTSDFEHGDFGIFAQPTTAICISSSGRNQNISTVIRNLKSTYPLVKSVLLTNGIDQEEGLFEVVISSQDETDIYGQYPPILQFYRLSILCDLLTSSLIGAEELRAMGKHHS